MPSIDPRRRRTSRPRIEALDSRVVLSGYSRESEVLPFFPRPGFRHTIQLAPRLVDDINADGILNKQERDQAGSAAGKPGNYIIAGTITAPPTGPLHGGLIQIEVVNAAGAVISDFSLYEIPDTGRQRDFRMFVPTSRLAEGDNSLRLALKGNGVALPPIYPFNITVNTNSVASTITPVAPAVRNRPVAESIRVEFSGPIDAATFSTADLSLTRDGGTNLIAGASGATIEAAAGSSSAFDVRLPAELTSAPGKYVLALNTATVTDPDGNPGAGTTSTAFEVVAVKPPRVGGFAAIAPAIRNRPLDEPVVLTFDQPIDPASFDADDLILTRDGGPNLVPGAAGIVVRRLTDTRYQVEGLGASTSAQGEYRLSVDAGGIFNTFGDPGSEVSTASFIVDLTAPALIDLPGELMVTVQPGVSGAVVTFPGPSASDGVTAFPMLTSAADGIRQSAAGSVNGSTFPIGTTVVRISAKDEAGNEATATFRVTVAAQALDLAGPTVVSVRPLAARRGMGRLVVAFDEEMARPQAELARNYAIRLAGRDRKFGTRDDVRIRPIMAAYDPATRSVTLGLPRTFPAGRRFRLSVAGSAPSGLADLAANLLDGDGDGRPGGDFVTVLKARGNRP